ncbi:MAG: MBL fold metallo-hydrolase [Patescibacteria group bacterium]
MYITWYGQSSFKLQNKEVTVLLDPYSSRQVGLRGPNFKAEIIILSDKQTLTQAQKDIKEGFLIDGPGEYEIKGVFILATKNKDNRLACQIELDEIKVGYLSEISQSPTDEILEKLNGVDILLLPIGNKKRTISTTEAVEIIRVFRPKIVIPSCYDIPGLKIQVDPLNKFLKEMGIKSFEPLDKLKIVKKELPEETKVIILKST